METAQYKTKLEEQLVALTEELQSLGIQNPDNADDWVATPEARSTGSADPNVVADKVEDWDERRATLSQLEIRYKNITRALKKIDDGTYGTCEISGEEIEADRLDANPAARTCKKHLEEEANLPT